MECKLKHIVIKPTLLCTANCPTCGTRKILHNNLINEKSLDIEEWKNILKDAYDLGAEKLDISGGEPTLYKYLETIITIGKKYNWYINMNTNGSLIGENRAAELIKRGLNNVYVSLYSHNSEKHDFMRGRKGLWNQAVKTIQIFASMQNKKFTLKTQTLINRNNYKDLPDLIKLNINLGATEMAIGYLEGDFNKKLLLNVDEIKEFKEKIIPKCIAQINCLYNNRASKNIAASALNNMFSARISLQEWSKGIYMPNRKKYPKCSRPKWFAIILANGDVHPCNAVEYTHNPVMGNVQSQSLKKIWHLKKYNDFRKNLFQYCEYCPINLYTVISLK